MSSLERRGAVVLAQAYEFEALLNVSERRGVLKRTAGLEEIKRRMATVAMLRSPSSAGMAGDGQMTFFKDFTFAWWQLSLLKLSMVALGLAIGSTWPGVFTGWRDALLILFAVPAFYVSYVWLKQI